MTDRSDDTAKRQWQTPLVIMSEIEHDTEVGTDQNFPEGVPTIFGGLGLS